LKTLVIMPCYQERASLETTVNQLFAAQPEINLLIIDDASPDGTGALADALAAADSRISVMHREAKQGLGSAYLAGFSWAIEREYDLIIEMDADGSHQALHLADMLTAAGGADLVIGSRWVPGGAVANWPASRVAISKLGNSYARFMLQSKVRDLTAGFRVYRRALLERLIATPIIAEGYAFQVELAVRAERFGAAITEVPITFIERQHGSSKMSLKIVVEAFTLVTRWGVAARFRRKPA
jgi:dolichol-phosphate mannosyltransferase